jgi:hypothetical protein
LQDLFHRQTNKNHVSEENFFQNVVIFIGLMLEKVLQNVSD